MIVEHKFRPEGTNYGRCFCDCSCGWTGGVYENRLLAQAAHKIHAQGGEPTGSVKPIFLIGPPREEWE